MITHQYHLEDEFNGNLYRRYVLSMSLAEYVAPPKITIVKNAANIAAKKRAKIARKKNRKN